MKETSFNFTAALTELEEITAWFESDAVDLDKSLEKSDDDDLRPEYDRSTLKGPVQGKNLDRYRAGTNLVLLAPDVRSAFPSDAAVNEALRSLMPKASS